MNITKADIGKQVKELIGDVVSGTNNTIQDDSKPFEFQEGDIVEFGGLEGVVVDPENRTFSLPLVVKLSNGNFASFTTDGRYFEYHTKPLLNLINRPKKKVKRVVKTTVRYSPILNKILSLGERSNEEILVTLEKEIEVEVDG